MTLQPVAFGVNQLAAMHHQQLCGPRLAGLNHAFEQLEAIAVDGAKDCGDQWKCAFQRIGQEGQVDCT